MSSNISETIENERSEVARLESELASKKALLNRLETIEREFIETLNGARSHPNAKLSRRRQRLIAGRGGSERFKEDFDKIKKALSESQNPMSASEIASIVYGTRATPFTRLVTQRIARRRGKFLCFGHGRTARWALKSQQH